MAFRYPIALDVTGRRCVVLGGGDKALARVEALLDSGAEVEVISAAPGEALERLAEVGRIGLLRREYRRGDLAGALVALAVTEAPQVRAEAFAEAERLGALFNAMDDPTHCRFAIPAILRRGELTVAISTGGKAPALAKRLRQDLGELLGEDLGTLVEALAEVRAAALAERQVDFDTWARRWEVALDQGLLELVAAGRVEEAKTAVRAALASDATSAPAGSGGRVPREPGARRRLDS